MKKANKLRTLLFTSLGAISVSFGLLITPKENVLGVDAAKKPNIEQKDGFVELGLYPQSIITQSSELFDPITHSEVQDNVYTYEGNKYTFMPVRYDSEGGGKYEDGSALVSNDQLALFKWEPIKWHVLYEDTNQNAMFLYASYTLDVMKWQENVDKSDDNNWKVAGTETAATSWELSTIRTYLNNDFYNKSFSEKERGYLKQFVNKKDKNSSHKEVNDYATIIDTNTFNEFKNSKKIKGGASDYAKSKELHYHWHDYNSGTFFWLNSEKDDYTHKNIDYVRGTTANDYGYSFAVDTQGMGVRPMIALDLSKVTFGGGTSESGTTAKKGTAKLIIGLLFSIFGIGGVVAFLILWNKGKLSPKMNVKFIIALVATFTVVSSVGLISMTSYASGKTGGGGGGCFEYGYYVQTGRNSGTSGGIDFVQVGSTAWLIKSDGTASYTGFIEDTENASDFSPDNYMTGTYKISGSTLTITIPETNIPNFGTVGGTYKYTIKNCKYLYYGNTEAYHWVRGE